MPDVLGTLLVNLWDWGGIYKTWRTKENPVGSARPVREKGLKSYLTSLGSRKPKKGLGSAYYWDLGWKPSAR